MGRITNLLTAGALTTALATSAIGLVPTPAHAAITVDETADELNADGDCSLREAVEAINTAAAVDACPIPVDPVIVLPAGTYDVGAFLEVYEDTSLVGAGREDTLLDCTNAGAGVCLNNLGVGSSLDLADLTMADSPAAMVNQTFGTGPVSLTDVELRGSGGPALQSGDGDITLMRARIADATGVGVGTASAAIDLVDSIVTGGNTVGVATDTGDVTLTRSTVAHRGDTGVVAGSGHVRLDASTVNSNGASGVRTVVGGVTATNSTIARNLGPAIVTVDGDIRVASSTLAQNDGRAFTYSGDGSIEVTNSILANDGEECDNPMVSGGFNIADDDLVGCTFDQPTDRVDLDPMLGTLGGNGGSTATYLPLEGSPAIDTGGLCPADDQRVEPRPADGDEDGDARCDVGAVEVQLDEPGAGSNGSDRPGGTGSAGASPAATPRPLEPRFTG